MCVCVCLCRCVLKRAYGLRIVYLICFIVCRNVVLYQAAGCCECVPVYKSHDTCSKSAINKSFSSSFPMQTGYIAVYFVPSSYLTCFLPLPLPPLSCIHIYYIHFLCLCLNRIHATHVIKVFVSLIALALVFTCTFSMVSATSK